MEVEPMNPINYSTEDVLGEIRKFVKGCTYETKISNDELVKSALFLLRTLPSARYAVLEHFCNVFDEAVNFHIQKLKLGDKVSGHHDADGADLDDVIADIQAVMLNFIKSSPHAWAPIISAWAIDLLGQISSKYSKRLGTNPSSSLNELLRMWMTCLPTKILIEIASECFACMVGEAPDVCVDALLEASVKHSPHFDWVVAHIGSCFPRTVITRVLMCGLKDFHIHGTSQTDAAVSSEENIPKMASVVGILGHLASQHGPDIRKALLSLFKESLGSSPCGRDETSAVLPSVIPFLLHLASMSSLLLRIIATDLIHTATPWILNKVAQQFSEQTSSGFLNSDNLINLVVHLLTKMDTGADRVILFLLNTACPETSPDAMETEDIVIPVVQEVCTVILDKLMVDLQRISQARPSGVELPLLNSLQNNTSSFTKCMVKALGKKQSWCCHLLACIGSYCGESCSADILQDILSTASNTEQLQCFIEILQDVQVRFPDVLSIVILRILDSLEPPSIPPEQAVILRNILHLVHWQTSQQAETSLRLVEVLHSNMPHLITQLYSHRPGVAKVTLEIIDLIGNPHRDEVSVILKLCAAVVNFFFLSLSLTDANVKCSNVRLCLDYIKRLSQDTIPQHILLRFLLEAALSKEFATVFGCKYEPVGVGTGTVEKQQVSLLEENKSHSLSLTTPQSHCSVFYAGVIGQGLKPLPRPSPYTLEEQTDNKQMLLAVLWVCSSQNASLTTMAGPPTEGTSNNKEGLQSISASVARMLATLLVELTTPDVLYNGIPWPEEDFMRITVERDLLIYKKFVEVPVLWDILDLVASGPGAVAICSPLLRGLMATLITHWESCREKSAMNLPQQLSATCKLMDCMKKGNILPTPMCHVGELFPVLTPYEVYLLLINTWRYLKENPPSTEPPPQKLTGCDPYFTDVIRTILHKNITTLGQQYSRFLPSGATSSENH